MPSVVIIEVCIYSTDMIGHFIDCFRFQKLDCYRVLYVTFRKGAIYECVDVKYIRRLLIRSTVNRRDYTSVLHPFSIVCFSYASFCNDYDKIS